MIEEQAGRDPLGRLLSWTVRKIEAQALTSLILELVILSSLIAGLSQMVRRLDFNLILPVGIAGLLLAWLAARTRLTDGLAGGLMVLAGFLGVTTGVGNLQAQWWALARTFNDLAGSLLRTYPGQELPALSPSLSALGDLTASYGVLLSRIGAWLANLFSARPAFDPVASALIWSLAIWLVAVWMSWCVHRRGEALQAVIPAAALLGFSLANTGATTAYLLPLLAATYLLVASSSYAQRKRDWQTRRVDYSEEIQLDVAIIALAATLGLTLLAAFSPALSPQKISDFIQRIRETSARRVLTPATEERKNQPGLGESLGLKMRSAPTQPPDAFSGLRAGGLPREHLLGSGAELSKKAVMRVKIEPVSTGLSQAAPASLQPRNYWRSLTYDRYTGRGWVSEPVQEVHYAAGQAALGGDPAQLADIPAQDLLAPGLQLIFQSVQLAGIPDRSSSLVYAAGELLSLNQPFLAAWRRLSGGASPAQAGDLFGAIQPSPAYQAVSRRAAPGVQELREAGNAYPGWVLDRYLQLPEEIPQRVLRLARDLTATQPTPYERAKAIETYLRTYTYNLALPQPPSDRDLVDYFLFDLKQGYCDYYASAMVVLLRAAGVPARLAIGYASGSYDAAQDSFVVTEADAHSWPEVYFPGFGWVAFEPTAGRAPLERPQESPAYRPDALSSLPALSSPASQPAEGTWLVWIAALAILMLAFCAVWFISDIVQLRRTPPPVALAALYQRLFRRAQRLQATVRASDTPHEVGSALLEHVEAAASIPMLGGVLPAAAQEIRLLVDLYTRSVYGPDRALPDQRQTAILVWQRLKWRLLALNFRKLWRRRSLAGKDSQKLPCKK